MKRKKLSPRKSARKKPSPRKRVRKAPRPRRGIEHEFKAFKKAPVLGKYTLLLLRKTAPESPLPRKVTLKPDIGRPKVPKAAAVKAKIREPKLPKVRLKRPVKKRDIIKAETELKKLKKKMVMERKTSLSKLKEEDKALKELLKRHEKLGVSEKSVVQVEGFPTYNSVTHGPITVFEGVKGYEEIERYWVDEPFSFAVVLLNPKTNERLYYAVEPALTESERSLLDDVDAYLSRTLIYEEVPADKQRYLAKKVAEAFKVVGASITLKTTHKTLYYIRRKYIGSGEIEALIKDPNIEDISCNGLNIPLYLYHRKYYHIPTNIIFKDEAKLNAFVTSLVERSGKMISFGKPTVDATMPDGSRLQSTLGDEITTRGSSFTIRKFAKEPFTAPRLIKTNTYSPEMLAYLWLTTENRKNTMIIGETASGKTSTLNAVAQFIPPDAKIVSLEETRELTLYQENWIPSVTREAIGGEMPISLYDLLRQGLRQRPECIIVGEVRGREGLVLFQAMSTGHTCHSTLHASNVQEAVNRLEGEPVNVPHQMVTSLRILCFQLISYLGKKRVRRVHSVIEFTGLDPVTGSIRFNEVYRWVPTKDAFEKVGDSFILREVMTERGWSPLELDRELKNRTKVLEYLAENDIVDHDQVSLVIRQYYADPKKLMGMIASKKLLKSRGEQ